MLNNFLRGNAHPEGFHPVISRGCIFSVCDYARENAWPSSCYTCLRCAQAFRREPATVCHRGGFACACARACFLWVPPPRALICPSFLPLGKKKDKLRTWEGNGLSRWLSDILRGRITVASGGYEAFLRSYTRARSDWHNGVKNHRNTHGMTPFCRS